MKRRGRRRRGKPLEKERMEKEWRTVTKGEEGEEGASLLEKERKEKEVRTVRKGEEGEGGRTFRKG